uniref:tyrosine-type recombinase/integrase n=1 Tax=Bacillaceae bacterium JMAK1 TaxID=1028381 RepID=UPI0003AC5178|nr:tyrosine-type recombinase/integrase [Bacillaceae bacterium JMAK1]AGQ45445.1 Phage integrase [Bacillaceae bacterium JMAK1]
MKFVEPIRDERKIKSMKKILKAQSDRDHLLFSVGINSPYRIGDLIQFQFQHLVDEKGKVLSHFHITEKKTGKVNQIVIGNSLQKDIAQYMDRYFKGDYNAYVFQSQKGNNQSISREHAWYIISQAAKEVGLKNIGAHSMRKTFGYHLRKKGTDIELIMELLNHSSTRETLRYIGITQDEKDHAVLSLDL